MFTKVNAWIQEWDQRDYSTFECVVLWIRSRFAKSEVA